ncbi:hypothetical protein LXL04_033227 [Taraxacum kok-saghyz]
MESEWRQVRRKGGRTAQATAATRDVDLMSLYVSNLLGGTNRSELWPPCAKLGDLVDIYVAGRKDRAGSFFAFVKFAKISEQANIDSIVKRLSEIEIRRKKLLANYAKHPRQGDRTFAEVAKGSAAVESKPVINLDCVPGVKSWIDNSVLVGDVRNFDTLCNFPSLIAMEGYDVMEIKYVGGLQVAVKFRSIRAAEVFKANKSIWLKWFVWVELFGKVHNSPGRIAWLKVVGVPVMAWDESNFAAIAGNFGRVLVDVASFWNCMDVAAGKVCILTKRLKKIKEEIDLSLSGTSFKVGVIELEDGWSPFSPFSTPSETDSDGEDDGNSEASDNINLEEREFVPETQNGGGDVPATSNTGGKDVSGDAELHGEAERNSGGFEAFNDFPKSVRGESTSRARRAKSRTPRPSGEATTPQMTIATPLIPNTINLNRCASPSYSKASDAVNNQQKVSPNSPTHSMDVEKTIEIGQWVGFQSETGVCDQHKLDWLARLKRDYSCYQVPVLYGGRRILEWVPGETIFVNIYAPQAPADNKELCDKLLNLMASRSGNKILFGDFNAVRRPEERLNSVFCPRIAYAFNKFIGDAGLLDLNMGGRRFTYFSDVGCKLSKIDRFLVCPNVLAVFPSAAVTALPREHFDYSPSF